MIHDELESEKGSCSDEGGKGIDVSDEYGGYLSGEDIPHDAAADTGDRTDEENENEVISVSHCHGYRCTADSKYAQPDGIGNIYGFRHDVLWHFDIAIRPLSPDFRSDEEYKAGQKSNAQVNGLHEECGRCNSQSDVPYGTAAYCRHNSHDGNAQNIQISINAGNESGNRKGNSTDDFQNKQGEFHFAFLLIPVFLLQINQKNYIIKLLGCDKVRGQR